MGSGKLKTLTLKFLKETQICFSEWHWRGEGQAVTRGLALGGLCCCFGGTSRRQTGQFSWSGSSESVSHSLESWGKAKITATVAFSLPGVHPGFTPMTVSWLLASTDTCPWQAHSYCGWNIFWINCVSDLHLSPGHFQNGTSSEKQPLRTSLACLWTCYQVQKLGRCWKFEFQQLN